MDPNAGHTADLIAIEKLRRRDIAATKAYDVEALLSLWSDDIVALPPGQAPIIGKAANRKMLEAGREASQNYETLEYEQDWKEIRIEGSFVYEWGTFRSAVRVKSSGEVIRQSYNVMRVLQRQPDGS